MLTLAVVALAAIAFTLAFMVWEYRNDNTNLQNFIDRLEQSREEMRLKIAAAERVQKNIEADKPKAADNQTIDQKRQALQSILNDPASSKLSARAIARNVGVSKTTVLNAIKARATPEPSKPHRVTKQTVLGKQKGRRVTPTKYPRAFISKDVNEWIEVAPRPMLKKALTNLLLNKRDYIQYNKRFDTYSIKLSHNYRAYTTGPFETWHEAREFRRRLFLAVAAREDANA